MSSTSASLSPMNRRPLNPTVRRPRPILAVAVVITLLALSFLPSGAFAQVVSPPENLTYQGYLVDGTGQPLGPTSSGPKNYDVIFRIWNDQTATDKTKNLLWSERQTITVDNGNFSVLLGEGNPLPGEPTGPISSLFGFANADAASRFVEVTVKGVGTGQDATITPRLRLMPGAYSFLSAYAQNANNAASATNAQNAQLAQYAQSAGSLGSSTNSLANSTNYNGLAFLGINSPTLITSPTGQSAELDLAGPVSTLRLAANPGPGGNSIQSLGNVSGSDAALSFTDHSGAPRLSITPAGNVGIGTSTPAAKLDVNGNANVTGSFTASSFAGPGIIPVGGIIMWSGSIASIPSGWALCDGGATTKPDGTTIRTPDLRDKFVVGAGSAYNPTDTGGAASFTMTAAQMPSHSHTFRDTYSVTYNPPDPFNPKNVWPNGSWTYLTSVPGYEDGIFVVAEAGGSQASTRPVALERPGTTEPAGATSPQPTNTLPPYFALAYIMRVQ